MNILLSYYPDSDNPYYLELKQHDGIGSISVEFEEYSSSISTYEFILYPDGNATMVLKLQSQEPFDTMVEFLQRTNKKEGDSIDIL